jgi:hypothetical protein
MQPEWDSEPKLYPVEILHYKLSSHLARRTPLVHIQTPKVVGSCPSIGYSNLGFGKGWLNVRGNRSCICARTKPLQCVSRQCLARSIVIASGVYGARDRDVVGAAAVHAVDGVNCTCIACGAGNRRVCSAVRFALLFWAPPRNTYWSRR